jgi:hypothetical protein
MGWCGVSPVDLSPSLCYAPPELPDTGLGGGGVDRFNVDVTVKAENGFREEGGGLFFYFTFTCNFNRYCHLVYKQKQA